MSSFPSAQGAIPIRNPQNFGVFTPSYSHYLSVPMPFFQPTLSSHNPNVICECPLVKLLKVCPNKRPTNFEQLDSYVRFKVIDAKIIDLAAAHRVRTVDVVQELPGAEEGDRAGGDEAGDPARGGQDGRRNHLQPQPGAQFNRGVN